MWWKSIIVALSAFGVVWFGKLSWIAMQHSGTGYLGAFLGNGFLAFMCVLIAIGFGLWLIFS